MIQVRDESRRVNENYDVDVQIDRVVVKASIMDRHNLQADRLHIPVTKGNGFSSFITKEFPVGFQDDMCSGSTTLDFAWPSSKACHEIVSESEDESIKLMPFAGFSSPRDCPATRALDLICKIEEKKKAGIFSSHFPPKKMIEQRSLKRDRCTLEEFDLSDLLDATQPVEDSISFPTIEWNFDEEDESDQTSSEGEQSPPVDDLDSDDVMEQSHPKRHCRGLVRSKEISSNLHHLEGIS